MSGPWEDYGGQTAQQTSVATQAAPWLDYANGNVADGTQPNGSLHITVHPAATPQQQALASVPGRIVTGMLEPVYGVSQLAPRAVSEVATMGGLLPPNAVSRAADSSAALQDKGTHQLESMYRDARNATGESGFDWTKLAGNMISPANLIMGEGAGLLPEAKNLGQRLVQGMGIGAAYGASSPVDTSEGSFAKQKSAQTVAGSAAGLATPLIGSGIANTVYPKVAPETRALLDEGIRVPMGLPKGLQDRASSFIPTIQQAQARSLQDLNTAVANRALNPIGKSLPDGLAGRDAVAYVKNTLGDAYNTLLPKLQGQVDPQFQQKIGSLKSMVRSLPKQEQDAYKKIIAREIDSRVSPNGSISGQSLKDIESGLDAERKNYSGVTDAYQRQLGNALQETQSSLRSMISRTNPQYSQQLQSINEGYANYARMRQAASSLGADQGVFTPAQLANAIKGADKTVGKGGYASGQAYMQDLSDAAKAVLPNKYPDSGTAGRVAMGYLAGGGAAALMHHPVGAMAGLSALGLYTRPGQAMARTLLTERPQALKPVAEGISKYSNPAALAKALTAMLSPAP